MTVHHEPARDIPVVEHGDVVVCGAGPAGFAAAIAAARGGAKTRLIEMHGCLGGVWTAGALSFVIDAGDKGGIMAELTDRLERAGARATHTARLGNFVYDVETMKLVLEQMCIEARVDVRLYTRVVAAARDANNRLSVCITESKSGREAWAGKCFVDATGDGDLAAQAGCGFDLGHPDTGQMQPMSLMAMLTGIELDDIKPFVNGFDEFSKVALRDEMRRAGVDPSYGAPTIFRVRHDFFAMMANHEYGVSGIDANDLTAATLRARSEVHAIIDGLRSLGGAWSNVRIVATGEQIGVREARRVRGRYTVTVDDLIEGRQHDDAVCRVNFGIDVHSTDASKGKAYATENKTKTQPYDIPLRALIARDVDGLLMAGRCISGDFLAHSSYRVTGDAAAMGEAAGVTAAIAATTQRLPHEVPFADIQDALVA